MRALALVLGLLAAASNACAQELTADDVNAIEIAAAQYLVPQLPRYGVIGLEPHAFRLPGVRTTWPRTPDRLAAIARVLGAAPMKADSVFSCTGRTPDTCRLSVDALVRVGEPFATPEGIRIYVSLRRPTNNSNSPIVRSTPLLIVEKQNGTWKIVGVARHNVT